jgi:hypothetical protein
MVYKKEKQYYSNIEFFSKKIKKIFEYCLPYQAMHQAVSKKKMLDITFDNLKINFE